MFCIKQNRPGRDRRREEAKHMPEQLAALTATIEQAAAGLRQRYTVSGVHALRVAIRRIRSILKQDGSPRARRMRKAWGALAAVSNDARDWDVFLRTARRLLTREEYREFARLNRASVRASHRAVKDLLQSEPWRRQLAEWTRYTGALKAAGRSRSGRAGSTRRALERAGGALQRATTDNDERAWHRFRIALKEVRYVAEAHAVQTPPLRELVAVCLPLQAALGAWHDSVIQLQMLAELPRDPVHARLRARLQATRRQSLSQTRALIAAQSLIVPPPPAPGTAPDPSSTPA